MSEICLFFGWETCARVTMTALEEIGLPFAAKRVDLAKAEHKSPEYLAINPNGEVPALQIDGHTLTQNPAILHYLDRAFPSGGLLPDAGPSVALNEPLQDLMWCASTLHILRRQVLNPGRFTTTGMENVRAKGLDGWKLVLLRIEKRLGGRQWWYGDTWSIVDVYLNWSFSGLMADWLKLSEIPALIEHQRRVQARPSYVRAMARERDGQDIPSDIDQVMPPGHSGEQAG